MSLFALPVSVNDLTQLQQGIEFFTDTTEATAEAEQITDPPNTPTMYSYAQQLLANNISLSQVALAVDSLMFGVTDNTTELTKLATQFLPTQAGNAAANGLNPTVYSAEALGLALAGGNGTSNAFAIDFGSLSIADFASEVSSLTGINSAAIEGFAQNWISFYTANPSATFGLSLRLAAYGAAFGDAVGAALLNPTVNGELALLGSEVQNTLIDNAEGSYQPGISLISESPHIPLQGEALLIANASGSLDWAKSGGGNYALFTAPPQSADFTIINAPDIFTLNTQHYATGNIEVDSASDNATVFTLIVGDSTAAANIGDLKVNEYATTEIIVVKGAGANFIDGIELDGVSPTLVIAGTGLLNIVNDGIRVQTIVDTGVALTLGDRVGSDSIDASNAPVLVMNANIEPFSLPVGSGVTTISGVTILGGTGPGNILHGSLFSSVTITFANDSTGESFGFVGADTFTGGSAGGDLIYGDAGADTITLPNHVQTDTVVFGEELQETGIEQNIVIAITDGSDVAYPGSWGAGATQTPIPNLFSGDTGGTSTDMTVITGFHAGANGDALDFRLAAWNGDSLLGKFLLATPEGDLVGLQGVGVVVAGPAQLSSVWVNNASNNALESSDSVLRYAPADASLQMQNAQQLATHLHSASDAIVLPGHIAAGDHMHILVAYDASFSASGPTHTVVNIADVDLVNTTASDQSSTANLQVFASDMVSLVGVSLTSLTPDNIHFI
jgi:hypothetical protein